MGPPILKVQPHSSQVLPTTGPEAGLYFLLSPTSTLFPTSNYTYSENIVRLKKDIATNKYHKLLIECPGRMLPLIKGLK